MELFFIGVTVADHPDNKRSAGFDVGGLHVFLVFYSFGCIFMNPGFFAIRSYILFPWKQTFITKHWSPKSNKLLMP